MSVASTSPQGLRRRRAFVAWIGAHGVLILTCALVIAPIYFLVLGSFKSVEEFFSAPFGLPQHFNLDNYRRAWTEASISTTIRNSAIVTFSAVLISTVVSCLASYAIARLPFRGSLALRLLSVGGLIVPVQLIMVAIFIIMRWIGRPGCASVPADPGLLDLRHPARRARARGLLPGAAEGAQRSGHDRRRERLPDVHAHHPPALDCADPGTVVILNGVWIWNDFFDRARALHEAVRRDAAARDPQLLRRLLDRVGPHLRRASCSRRSRSSRCTS